MFLNFLILILLIIPLNAEFITKEFSIIDGLLEGNIRDIFKDDIGRIWTLTDNGVTSEFADIEIDKMCLGILEEAIGITNEVKQFYIEQNDFRGSLKLCEQRLNWDTFDVEMSQIKIKTLIEIGHKVEAIKNINSFYKSFKTKLVNYPN